MAVAVQLRARRRHGPRQGRADRVGVVADERVPARLHRLDPLRRLAQRHARDAVEVRLLLRAAGVGEQRPGAAQQRRELQVAGRLAHLDGGAEREARGGERGLRARVQRQDHALAEARQRLDQPPEHRLARVRLAVDRRQHVGRIGPRDAVGERAEQARRVGHHVAHHVHAARDALGRQVAHRDVGRAQQQVGDGVDQHAVDLLRHRPVERAQARLDVGHRQAELRGRERRRQRRVGVAVDDDPVRRRGGQHRLDALQHARGRLGVRAGADLEPVGGRRDAELVVEDARQAVVVVLPRVDHHHVSQRGERQVQRRRLHELRAVADDGDDPHQPMACSRSAIRSSGSSMPTE